MSFEPKNNPNRKFCYTYWCYCDWYDECQKNKRSRRADDHCGDGSCDVEAPDDTPHRAAGDGRREEKRHRRPQGEPYEFEVRFEDEDQWQDDREARRGDQSEEQEIEIRMGPRDEEEEDEEEEDSPSHSHRSHGQKHVHEYWGSTKLFEKGLDRHNHRFAGVTGEAISVPGGHVHKVWTRTDYFGHFHVACKLTGLAIPVGMAGKGENKKHIHPVEGSTSVSDSHDHQFEFATQINEPLLPLEERTHE